MESEFNTLLASIRDCNTYPAVKARLDAITQRKFETTDTAAVRALRDAQVYALVWGVAAAAHDIAALDIAIDSYDQGDDTAFEQRIEAREAAGTVLETAIGAVREDANAAANGSVSDAVADANAADEAYRDAQPYIVGLAGEQITRDNAYLIMQLQDFIAPVSTAAQAYVNQQVEQSRQADTLKALLNTYLLVWRKTTTGGGNPLAEQGILESIDEQAGTFVLRSTVYKGQRNTVAISDISRLDTSRTGSGARQSAVTPGWRNVGLGEWVRSDQY